MPSDGSPFGQGAARQEGTHGALSLGAARLYVSQVWPTAALVAIGWFPVDQPSTTGAGLRCASHALLSHCGTLWSSCQRLWSCYLTLGHLCVCRYEQPPTASVGKGHHAPPQASVQTQTAASTQGSAVARRREASNGTPREGDRLPAPPAERPSMQAARAQRPERCLRAPLAQRPSKRGGA